MEIAGLAAGIVGFVSAVFYQAIGGALFVLFPATSLGLAFGAAITSSSRRRALAMWALVLGSFTLGVVAGAVGVHLGLFSGLVVYAGTPMLTGIAAILLSATALITGLAAPRPQRFWGSLLGSPRS
jgi:hypothetical protein